MTRNTFKILLLAAGMFAFGSCQKKFEQYTQNLNQPATVPPSQLLRTVLADMYVAPFGQEERNDQFTCSNYDYYDNNLYWDGTKHSQYATLNYQTLFNVLNMEASAFSLANAAQPSGGGDPKNNPYAAMGKFFRAWFFVNNSLKVGDLPMTQALQGSSNLTPKYDTQKQIFIQSNLWLDSANTIMAAAIANGGYEFSGDSYYADFMSSGDALKKWQKAINTFRLRVLIELSKKASDADLNVAGQFATILGNPTKYPIMTSMDDNLEFHYNTQYNKYPNNNEVYGTQSTRYNMAAAYTDSLASFKDLRVMMTAEPARGLGHSDTSYASFKGANTGLDLSVMAGGIANSNTANVYALINRHRYYETLVGEPCFILSYPEMCFNIAEGINRQWATGNAEQWYQNGIYADFGFYGVVDGSNTVTFQQPSGTLGQDVTYTVPFSYSGYYNQPLVKYDAANPAHALEQVLEQKYLALFRNSGLEAYFQWRRTGVPGFLQGSDQVGYGNGGNIPLRFQYPQTEATTNAANYTSAIQSQYGGNDNINQAMWLIK